MKRGSGSPLERADERLGALAARWSLDAVAVRKLRDLLILVRDDRGAATSVRSPEQAVHVHVADSLCALPFLEPALSRPAGGARAVDVGSGAGFPGLPLAIVRPKLDVDLLESTRHKCDFLERAALRLDVPNAVTVNRRAEEWGGAEGRERYDVVLVRAVASLATLVEYAAPLLSVGGSLIAWKGSRDRDEEAAAGRACAEVGLQATAVERVTPYPGSRGHNLHLYEKSRATPARFPRRAGAAHKNPLG